jgi:hypothetical protein
MVNNRPAFINAENFENAMAWHSPSDKNVYIMGQHLPAQLLMVNIEMDHKTGLAYVD